LDSRFRGNDVQGELESRYSLGLGQSAHDASSLYGMEAEAAKRSSSPVACATVGGTNRNDLPYRILPLRSGGRCRQAVGGALRTQRRPLPAFGHLPPQAGEGTASALSSVGTSYRILPLRSGEGAGRRKGALFGSNVAPFRPSATFPRTRGKEQRPRFQASTPPSESFPFAAEKEQPCGFSRRQAWRSTGLPDLYGIFIPPPPIPTRRL
jgi:hypothetical protein